MRVLSPPDTLRSGGNSLQTPDDWIGRIQGSTLALVVADREADTWASLQRWPLGQGRLGHGLLGHGLLGQGAQPSSRHSPVWLVLPADWQQHPVLRHTARELGWIGDAQQLEG